MPLTGAGPESVAAAYTPDGNRFYAYDGNGNIATLVSTADGAVSATYDYSPFGLTVSKTGPAANANTYQFSTKPIDKTGLYYYGFRYYNPMLGRWMSRDRGLLSFGGEVQQDYSFCQNNSASYTDPFGNIAEATDRDPRLGMLPVPNDYFDEPGETPDPELHDPFKPKPPPPPNNPGGIPNNCQLHPAMCGGLPIAQPGCSNPWGNPSEERCYAYTEISHWHPPCWECVKYVYQKAKCEKSGFLKIPLGWNWHPLAPHTIVWCRNLSTGQSLSVEI